MNVSLTKKLEGLVNQLVEKQLFKAADKMRKNIDAADYKQVVLGLIFLKYISDAFEVYREKLKAGETDFGAYIDLEDRDLNATTHGQRDLDDDRLSNIIGKSYDYNISPSRYIHTRNERMNERMGSVHANTQTIDFYIC